MICKGVASNLPSTVTWPATGRQGLAYWPTERKQQEECKSKQGDPGAPKNLQPLPFRARRHCSCYSYRKPKHCQQCKQQVGFPVHLSLCGSRKPLKLAIQCFRCRQLSIPKKNSSNRAGRAGMSP